MKKIIHICLISSLPFLAIGENHRDVTFAQINVKNNADGVLLCGVGGMPSYTHESNIQEVNSTKFSLPYLKSPVGKHYGDDDPMGSGALSPYWGYYADGSGKNLAMFAFDGELIDGSYNSSTSDDERYNPYNLDYYYYDTNDSMRNLIRVSFTPTYIITPSYYEKDADGTDHGNPFSKDVFTSDDLTSISFSDLEPKSGWYDNDYSSWGNLWFTHQYITNGAIFSHGFKFLSDQASDHQDQYDQESSMGLACLVYDSKESADARAAYGSGMVGYFKIRFVINDSTNSARIAEEKSPGISLGLSLGSKNSTLVKKKKLDDGSEKKVYLLSSEGGDGGQLPTVLRSTYSVNYNY